MTLFIKDLCIQFFPLASEVERERAIILCVEGVGVGGGVGRWWMWEVKMERKMRR